MRGFTEGTEPDSILCFLGYLLLSWELGVSSQKSADSFRVFRMNVNLIKTCLERAREIIGDRSRAEIDYDNGVVAHLGTGLRS